MFKASYRVKRFFEEVSFWVCLVVIILLILYLVILGAAWIGWAISHPTVEYLLNLPFPPR